MPTLTGPFGRRRFLAAGTGAAAGAGILSSLAMASPVLGYSGGGSLVPEPAPIPGGTDLSSFGLLPPFDFIHLFTPGPVGVVLPFSGIPLEGLDVEPSTITDFRGRTAVAYIAGSATASDGVTYGLEVDIRAYRGAYVSGGATHRGTFALV